MNCLNFVGFIGRDAETRFTASGDAIVSFSVALTSGYGEKAITTWLNCSMFGKRGQAVSQYLLRSTQVGITGEFSARPYTTKDGVEKLSLEVRVDNVTLLGKKEGNAKPESPQNSKPAQSKPVTEDDFDQDAPF